MKRISRIFIIAAAALAFGMVSLGTAFATCDPTNSDSGRISPIGPFHDGWQRPTSPATTNFDWITADIDAQSPFVFHDCCAGAPENNISYGYVMLYGAGSNWAQIGPAILNNGNRTDLIQCNNNGVAQDFEISTSSAGSSPTFKVEQYFGTVSVFKNGSDEWGCSSFTVTDAEFSGEIVEAHDQMIGDTANHDTFHNSKVKKHNDSTIYDGYSNGNGLGGHVATGDWFGRSRPNNYTMDVWDQDC